MSKLKSYTIKLKLWTTKTYDDVDCELDKFLGEVVEAGGITEVEIIEDKISRKGNRVYREDPSKKILPEY